MLARDGAGQGAVSGGVGLKVHLHEIFFVLFSCTHQTYVGQIIRLLNFFDFVLEFADLLEFLNIRQ